LACGRPGRRSRGGRASLSASATAPFTALPHHRWLAACAYSRDGARTWTEPAYKTYTPGGSASNTRAPQLRVEMRQRKVSLLVPQPRRTLCRRTRRERQRRPQSV
jgi:hypothetical protein